MITCCSARLFSAALFSRRRRSLAPIHRLSLSFSLFLSLSLTHAFLFCFRIQHIDTEHLTKRKSYSQPPSTSPAVAAAAARMIARASRANRPHYHLLFSSSLLF